MHANKREEIDEIYAGDIGALVGLKRVFTGDTLCDERKHPVVLESIEFPEPVIEIAIEPKTKADQEKLGEALQKLALEDPTFRVTDGRRDRPDPDLRYRASCTSRSSSTACCASSRSTRTSASPQVAYKETIRQARRRPRAASCARAVAGPVRPRRPRDGAAASPGSGLLLRDQVVGGRDAARVLQGGRARRRRSALQSGVLAGFPVVDVHVRLVDGSYHDVDSSEMAFQIAGSMGAREGLQEGQAAAARADHGARGRRARGASWGDVIGRPEQPSRPGLAVEARGNDPGDPAQWCRWRRTCSAT